MNWAYWINSAWMLGCRREASAFRQATRAVAETQRVVLQHMLTANRNTNFGRQHGFASIGSYQEYQRRVPLATYDSYAGAIQEIAAGKNNILTAERVELLEPTSGTTSGEKWIPYTSLLRRQFQRAVAVWVADAMRHRPGLRRGRAYWSISPPFGPPRKTAGGISIGFDNDAAYLSRWQQFLVRQLLVVPSTVTLLRTLNSFRYFTLFYLAAAADLALISIWSPTFLTSLLSSLEEASERICRDLRHGQLSIPSADGPAEMTQIPLGRRQRWRRVDQLDGIFRQGGSWTSKLREIWPQLDLISCWADGTAASYLPELRALFPDVAVQPKGLLSTEACVSFPLSDRPGTALALRSHFFEFSECGALDDAEPSAIRLAHELEMSRRYQVVVTTGGGLYRYQLRDVVEVTGFENQCPLVRFVGRADRVSDLVGEKLAEAHVQEVLSKVFAVHRLAPRFAMIVPQPGDVPGYCLYLRGQDVQRLKGCCRRIARDTEAGLRDNPHYRLAVELGQLRPLETRILENEGEPSWQAYERACVARGRKLGGLKPTVLALEQEDATLFEIG
jgi:hypothetical protein